MHARVYVAAMAFAFAGCVTSPLAAELDAADMEDVAPAEESYFGNATAAGVQYLVRAGAGVEDVPFDVPLNATHLNVTLRQRDGAGAGLSFHLEDPQGRSFHLPGTLKEDIDVALFTVHVVAGANTDSEASITVEDPSPGKWRAVLWSQGAALTAYEIMVVAER